MSQETTATDRLPVFDAPAGGRLCPEMLEAYRRNGVILLRDFADPGACRELRQRALELVDAFDPTTVQSVFSTTGQEQLDDRYFIDSGDKIRFFLEEEACDETGRLRQAKTDCVGDGSNDCVSDSLNKMGHAMHDLDPVFDAFSRTPELAEVVRRLGFEAPGIIQSMYIFKPPRIGGAVVCHQDSTYIYTEPESCVGFWFAIDDATLENACMEFIPGAHKGPLKQRNYRVSAHRLVTEIYDDTPWPEHRLLPAEAPAGTLAIFDGRAPHRSGPNRSDKPRHAYTLHVIDQRCHYPANNWLQRGPELPLRGFAD